MYYAITFTNASNVSKNTWTNWRLIPTSPPMVEPPEPYTNYAEIPGRVEGPIDLSEALSNGPSFKNSEGSWEFVEAGTPSRTTLYQELKTFLHGKQMKIIFEEDPTHYYIGRISVTAPKTGKGPNMFGFKYTIRPVRYLLNGTIDGV